MDAFLCGLQAINSGLILPAGPVRRHVLSPCFLADLQTWWRDCPFSTLDVRSGYWQVPLSLESKPMTAFCTNKELWKFKVLNFRICNVPATFERLMDSILAGVPLQQCLVYLDDLVVHGASFEEDLDSL